MNTVGRLVAVAALLVAGSSMAEEAFVPLEFGRRQVLLSDYLPHLRSEEGYSEQWSFGVWNQEGRFFIGIDVIISNIGMGDHNGGFKVRWVDAEGKEHTCADEYDDDEWSFAKNAFKMDFGDNHVRGDKDVIFLSTRCDKMKMELEFKNVAPPAFPGNGTARFGEDGIYTMFFPSPRARVSGTITRDGESQAIEGWGFAEHSYSSMAPYKQMKRWFRFKLVNSEISIVLAEFESTEDYGRGRSGWAIVSNAEGAILATAQVRFEFDKFIEDKKSEGGYTIPRLVRMVAVDGENRMQGVMVMSGLQRVDDPTASLGALKRAVVRRFTKPRDYYINCTYDFRIEKAGGAPIQIKGDGIYRFMHVNP